MFDVIKRSGSIVEFDLSKIKKAIEKAFDACDVDFTTDMIDFITLKVTADFQNKIKDSHIGVEQIQDSVEKVLMDSGYTDVAKAYILYRKERDRLRRVNGSLMDYKRTVDNYLNVNDWRVKENSTVTYSLGGLILSNSGAMTANYWLSDIYDDEIANAHKNADIHIHDLSMLSGYCFTGDTRIKTFDGENPTFKELVDSGRKNVTVFAYDKKCDDFVPAAAENPRVTRVGKELVRVELWDGKEIQCTPDHRFMLEDGTYREAEKLAEGTRLMSPNLIKVRSVEKIELDEEVKLYDITVPGYENFQLDAGVFVHNCAGWSLKQLILEGLGGVPGKITSAPAKHLSTLCNQMVNFLGILQNEWAGAQAFSSFDTYLAPFVKVDNLTYDEVKQCIQSFVYGNNISSRWGCLPITTEVFTPDGWKGVDELSIGDPIFTWQDGVMRPAKLRHIIRRKNDYDVLHRYKGQNYVQTVTPEHRCIVGLGTSRSSYAIRQSMDIFHNRKDLRMPASIDMVEFDQVDNSLTDEEVIFAAMYYADGTADLGRMAITKSKRRDTGAIKSVLETIGLNYTIFERKDNETLDYKISSEHKDYVGSLIGDKYKINQIFTKLDQRQSRLFIHTWASFDGKCDLTPGTYKLMCQYDTEEIGNVLEVIMLRAGYLSHRWSRHKSTDKNATSYIMADNRQSAIISERTEIPYTGEVWCPNTDVGTAIYKDEDGNIFISGNCQAPFTNITLDWTVPPDLADMNCIVGGKELDFTYKDCKKEMDMINKAFLEIMIEGDANGRGFQYPIPTYSITKDFDWSDTENNRLLFEMTAKYGTPYFSNYINSDMEPSDVRSMCCRLRLDLRELRRKSGGFFGSGESTGSIGVVTINMPRIAYLSKDKSDFYSKLDHMMDIAARSLDVKRKVVTEFLKRGLYPYTKRYLGTFSNHFSTIGLVGMNEACLNARWLGKDLTHDESQKFTAEVLNHMRNRLSDYQEQYGDLFNLEATPAESTAYRLAKHDVERYPGIITAAKSCDDTPYYTNSSHLPVGYTEDVFSALDVQDELQTLYTSGTVFHAFLGEKLPSWKSAAELVRKIAENYRLPYYTLSPTYSVCSEHGYIQGEVSKCPTCGKPTEIYSRITGYYRPVQNWNDGKLQEFSDRKTYDIGRSRMTHRRRDTNAEVPKAEEQNIVKNEKICQKSILFATTTCPNCKIISSFLDKIGFEYEKIYADQTPDKAREYKITNAPTLVVVYGNSVEKYSGVPAIKRYIESVK